MAKKRNRIFENKYFDLQSAIKKDYIDNGIGCLAAKITKYEDVISRYSGEGYECLNPEFYHYINRNVQYIPSDIPILLQIYGCKLTKKQQELITDNIREHYSYKLGEVIEENKNKTKRVGTFVVLASIFLILSLITEDVYEYVSSFLNLAFCFYGSSVITFFATGAVGSKNNRIRAAQLANMYITIEEELNTNHITEEDKKIIYSSIKEKDNH